jgi:hypothetical protein
MKVPAKTANIKLNRFMNPNLLRSGGVRDPAGGELTKKPSALQSPISYGSEGCRKVNRTGLLKSGRCVRRTLKLGSVTGEFLVRKATPDKVLDELKGFGGKVLHTSLTHEKEAKLQAALDAARQQTGA